MAQDEKTTNSLLDCCLYFTSNALARVITRMAEQAFAPVAMTPSHAFLLMLAIETPGISQKELAAELHLAPSTVSRFVDALIRRGYLEKEVSGRNTFIRPTVVGETMKEPMDTCWKTLYEEYSQILGEEEGNKLNELIRGAGRKLEEFS
jgi:DNA-binding MarR family transcriptional regulator